MSAEIVSAANGVITLKISGTLTQPELAAAQSKAVGIFRAQGPVRILVLLEDFKGWAQEGDWGDLSFMFAHDSQMERMAIVGDEKWKDMAVIFAGKGLRRCLVEYFRLEDAAKARGWLLEQS